MFPTLLFFITSTSGGQGDRKYDAMKSYLPVWLLVIALLCGVTRAEAFEVDGIYYDLTNEGAVVVSGDTPYSGDVVIPASINFLGDDFPVVSIGDEAFYQCSNLTSITLPESVTSIGGYAFQECSGLTSIMLPESVTSIGDRAFLGCANLEGIVVSEENPVYSSLDGVLYNKDKTELLKWPDKKLSVTIPESVTSIGDWAFYYCSGLTSITLPESVTSIGDYAFSYCRGLTSMTIPASVERLGTGVFSACMNLEEIIVSANNPVYSSLDGVLYNKDKTELLKWPNKKLSVTIPEWVTSIGDYAFSYCYGLTTITLPESVTSIGDWAFYYCSGLISIMLPESVTSIGDRAFSYCHGLTSIEIPNSVTSIGDEAFYYCSGLTSITLSESLTSIGRNTFSCCTGLTSITLPESLTSIGVGAFSGCSGLTTITLPESVTSIGYAAFSGCSGLTTITLPESLTSIGERAFYGCTGLTTITLPESLTSIGDEAFYLCSNLTSITLPESLTSIGDYAFANCNQLESVTVHAVTPPEIGLNTFDNYGIPLYVPAGCKEAYQAAKYWRYFRNIQEMESSVETVLDSEARIYVENHTLHVENVDGDYRVYTITGRLVYAGHAATVQLADAGVYVVRTNSLSQKVIVK